MHELVARGTYILQDGASAKTQPRGGYHTSYISTQREDQECPSSTRNRARILTHCAESVRRRRLGGVYVPTTASTCLSQCCFYGTNPEEVPTTYEGVSRFTQDGFPEEDGLPAVHRAGLEALVGIYFPSFDVSMGQATYTLPRVSTVTDINTYTDKSSNLRSASSAKPISVINPARRQPRG